MNPKDFIVLITGITACIAFTLNLLWIHGMQLLIVGWGLIIIQWGHIIFYKDEELKCAT